MSQQPPNLDQFVRNLQIVTLALVMGAVLFAGIVVFLWFSGNAALNQLPRNNVMGPIISSVAAGYAVVAFVLHLIVPSAMARKQSNGATEEELYGVYQIRTIIGLALLEGAAFFNLVACMIEQQWWSLAIVGGLIFWMLAMFPTHSRVAHWVETQQMLRHDAT